MKRDEIKNITKNGYVDYKYYLYGTESEAPKDIESLFNDGISTWFCKLEAILKPVNERKIKKDGIDKVIYSFISENPEYNTVCVVKIPNDYLANVQKGDGSLNPPIPLFKDNGLMMYGIKEYLLNPHLIQGAYCYSTDIYIDNPNFCPVFDAKGLKYSVEQLDNIAFYNKSDWNLFANFRNDYSFEVLYMEDKKMPTLDNAMKEYSNKYHTKAINHPYISTEYSKVYRKFKDDASND